MSSHYKLRITLTSCNISQIQEFLGRFKQYALVEEIGKQEENPHVHIYLVNNEDIKEDTMRTQLRKLSSSSRGNKLYSLVKLDLEEDPFAVQYLAYMMKEGKVRYSGFPVEWLDEAKKYDLKVKEEIKVKKEKKVSRTKRLFKAFEEDHPNPQESTYISVIDWVVAFFIKEECNVSVSTLSSWTNTILLRYDIAEHRLSVQSVIMRQLTIQ